MLSESFTGTEILCSTNIEVESQSFSGADVLYETPRGTKWLSASVMGI